MRFLISNRNFKKTGLGEGNTDVKLFYQIIDKFIADGESQQGKIPLKGYQRIIQYILTNTKSKICQVNLLYDKTV